MLAVTNCSESANASPDWGWTVNEMPVFIGPGEQVNPVASGRTVFFNDLNMHTAGLLVKKDIYSGLPGEQLYGPGLHAGPDADSSSVVWQNSSNQVCRRILTGGEDQCISSYKALRLAVSGDYAISEGGTSYIRVFDFSEMSSRIVDKATSSGMRYDPSIDGEQAVWIKERGYAGRYYEPLVVHYDVRSGISTYLTKTGGGTTPGGSSRYNRRNPVISNDLVLYQERIDGATNDWNISIASLGTFGSTVVDAPGDQINPSLDGRIVVYQDNRTGHKDEEGHWVGEWDIYLKDLDSGIEQPVCTAPGDQTNPIIKGNIITWEDERNGDPDIYAAVLSPAGEDQQLMQSYAPTLVFDRDEDFRPVESGVMVAEPGTALFAGGQELLRAPETLTLDALGGFGADSNLDLAGSCLVCGPHLPDPTFDRYIYTQYVKPYNQIMGSGMRQGVYGRVVRRGDRTVIQYWLNYYFNNHTMLSHEGDWELIEVELDGNGQPDRVSASQHSYGRYRRWSDAEIQNGHPVIYVARGSHANYFEPGDHGIEINGVPTLVGVDETDELGTGRVMEATVMPLPGTIFEIPGFRWLDFRGGWGEKNENPDGSAPLGPAWSGDRWSNPFAWERLEWDGFEGARGIVAGLRARVDRLVRIDLFDSLGGHLGEDAAGVIEKTISGSQYLDAPEINQKAIIAPFGDNTDYLLVFTADAVIQTPIRLTIAEPVTGMMTTLAYNDVPFGAGAMATINITRGVEPAVLALLLDADNDGVAETAHYPDEISQTPLDFMAPSAIDDLRAERTVEGTARLQWTAPGDDADAGAGTMYSIRFSQEPITEENWVAAEPVLVTDRPLGAGSGESIDISGLAGEGLHFAVRTTDDAGNESGISNIAFSSFESPRLTLSLGAVHWKSYSDFLIDRLTVVYSIGNAGFCDANEVQIRRVVTVPSAVTVADPYPVAIASLIPGEAAELEVAYIIPQGIRSFRTILSASCKDSSGFETWFGQLPE